MRFTLSIASESGDVCSAFEIDWLKPALPGDVARELPHHFKGLVPVEAVAEERGVRVVFKLEPTPDPTRARIFLICFESFVETLAERLWKK